MADQPSIHQALAAVMGDVQSIGKTGRNESQGFNFRGVDAVVNAVGPVLRKHSVVVVPVVLDAHYEQVEVGRNRSLMRQCTLRVEWQFHGPAGDHLSAVVSAEAMDSGDKATSKAHSVALRTALLQVLCIPTNEPDPDEQTYERSEARRPPRHPAGRAKPELVDLFRAGGYARKDAEAAAGDVWKAGPCPTKTGDDEVSDDEWAELEQRARDLIDARAADAEPKGDS